MRLALLLVAGMSMVSTGAIAQAQPDGMESTAVLALRHVKDAQTFVGLAGVYDLFIVQASEIALERSRHPRIRDFATAMIEAHRTSYDRLWQVVREARGPEPPRGIDMRRAEYVDDLRKIVQNQFDDLYIRLMAEAHDEAVALFESYARDGDNARLRAHAFETLTMLEEHVRMIDAMTVEDLTEGAP